VNAPLEALWRLAFPEHCAVCGELLGLCERHVCAPCREALPWVGPSVCPRCGDSVGPASALAGGCAACRGRHFAFRRAVAPLHYEGVVRDLLLAFKLGRRPSLAYVLGSLLCGHLAESGVSQAADLVAPVPLHWLRRVQRGFNQADLLALEIGARFRLPVAPHLLRRRRATVTQTAFSVLSRSLNVRGAFVVRAATNGRMTRRLWSRALGRIDLLGKRVLLVDDILTTGSTAHECAKALRRAGAGEVVVATVARTLWPAR